jgi:hypothetical protein
MNIKGEKELIANLLKLAVKAAEYTFDCVNSTTEKAGKETIPSIASREYNIKKEDVSNNLNIKLSDNSNSRFETKITTTDSTRPNLVNFNALKTDKGVSYNIRQNGNKEVAGAFISRKTKKVFKREDTQEKLWKRRIYPLKGPSIPVMLIDVADKIMAEYETEITKNMNAVLDSLVKEFEKD